MSGNDKRNIDEECTFTRVDNVRSLRVRIQAVNGKVPDLVTLRPSADVLV